MHAEPIVSHQSGEIKSPNHTEIMPPAEVLARASAFDPTQPNREGIMRLALEMIAQQYDPDPWVLSERIKRTAEQALKECA